MVGQLPLWARPQMQWLNMTLKNMAMSPPEGKKKKKENPNKRLEAAQEIQWSYLIGT